MFQRVMSVNNQHINEMFKRIITKIHDDTKFEIAKETENALTTENSAISENLRLHAEGLQKKKQNKKKQQLLKKKKHRNKKLNRQKKTKIHPRKSKNETQIPRKPLKTKMNQKKRKVERENIQVVLQRAVMALANLPTLHTVVTLCYKIVCKSY